MFYYSWYVITLRRSLPSKLGFQVLTVTATPSAPLPASATTFSAKDIVLLRRSCITSSGASSGTLVGTTGSSILLELVSFSFHELHAFVSYHSRVTTHALPLTRYHSRVTTHAPPLWLTSRLSWTKLVRVLLAVPVLLQRQGHQL